MKVFHLQYLSRAVGVAVFFALFLCTTSVYAQQTVHIDASKLLPTVSVAFSPRSGSFVEGSTFEVPVLLDTQGANINAIDIKISFDADKLMVIQPSGGKSVVGLWVAPPTYDNTRGTIGYSGVVPGGITTGSGLIGNITFKAKSTGSATLRVRSDSSVLLNDGLGTDIALAPGRADYKIISKPPEGVRIFSETNPDASKWYNSNSPVIAWDRDPGVSGFSYVLDDKPLTIPENTVNTKETVQAYSSLGDGVWYFHVKAYKNGVWGTTGHFLLKIDTTPPANFTPEINYILASASLVERSLVSFFTIDNLSGINHYEVGVIDKGQPISASPVFVETESPFQAPLPGPSGLRVIVRAVDNAGNARDVSLDVGPPPLGIITFLGKYLSYILAVILLIMILTLLIRYFIGHHMLAHLREAIEDEPKTDAIVKK